MTNDAPTARGWIEAPEHSPRQGRFAVALRRAESVLAFVPDGGVRPSIHPWHHVNFVRLCQRGDFPPEVPEHRGSLLREWPDPTTVVGTMSGGSRHWLGWFVFGLVPAPPYSGADWLRLFEQHGVLLHDDE